MTGWTDTHCHLQDAFVEGGEPERALADALARAAAAGVDRAVVVGTGEATSRQAMAIAQSAGGPVELWATVGLHPHDASDGTGPVAALAREGGDRLVAVGECGLDYFYEHSPRPVQRQAFAEQVGLAHELGLALVVHARDAWDDLLDILGSEGVPNRTVIHCFTGGPGDAERCLAAGCDLSYSGVVTFKNADDVREAARRTPLERLHLETDSPFLAPVPFRGRPNEPAHVAVVGAFVADIVGVDVDVVRAAAASNASRLFGLLGKPR